MENKIFILGPEIPCKRCKATREIIEELLKNEFKEKKVSFEHLNMLAPENIAKFGVLKGPAVVINNTIVSEGEIPNKDLMKKKFNELLK